MSIDFLVNNSAEIKKRLIGMLKDIQMNNKVLRINIGLLVVPIIRTFPEFIKSEETVDSSLIGTYMNIPVYSKQNKLNDVIQIEYKED